MAYSGMSVIEMCYCGKDFVRFAEQTKAMLRELLAIQLS